MKREEWMTSWKARKRRSDSRGNILIEACLVISLLFWGIGMNLELVRRSRIEMFSHHLAFLFARGRAMGVARASLREQTGAFYLNPLAVEDLGRRERGLGVKVFHYYPSFFQFEYSAGIKRRFEVTRECWFRY